MKNQHIAAEIAYYPLAEQNFAEIIGELIEKLPKNNIEYVYTPMSTILYGMIEDVLAAIKGVIEEFFARYQSILEVKFSNACPKN